MDWYIDKWRIICLERPSVVNVVINGALYTEYSDRYVGLRDLEQVCKAHPNLTFKLVPFWSVEID
jgi:hypothetical protein